MGSTLDFGDDDGFFDTSGNNEYWLEITPNNPLKSIDVTWTLSASGYEYIEIRDLYGNTLASDTNPSDTTTLNATLEAGTTYRVVTCTSEYGTYTHGSFPYSSFDINSPYGYADNVYNIRSITADVAEPPDAPYNVSSVASGTSVDVSWDHASWGSETGDFEILRSTDGSNYSQIASTTYQSYTDTGLDSGEKYWYKIRATNSYGSNTSGSDSTVTSISTPTGVSATVQTNDQIDVGWDDVTSNGQYRIQINRDGNGWNNPSGGPTTVGQNTTSVSYGPNSDNSYNTQVGIDSKFRFRVKSETNHTSSNWSYSPWVYTEPIPPHNPSVTRPDANTIKVSWENKSNIATVTKIRVREDTGSGYGSWANFRNVNPSDGSTTISVGDVGRWDPLEIKEDARYQIKIGSEANQGSKVRPSPYHVYADYGNEGNVYFEDDFESGDLSKWRNTPHSTVTSGSGMDSGFSGADQGSNYARIEADGHIDVQLPDIGSESDVIVKAAVGVGSADTANEELSVEFWDGGTWQQLTEFAHEYNKQGWVEVTALVPDSYLGGGDYIKFNSNSGGGGDHYYVDRVVVSDILHEYTKPAAPSGLQLTTNTQGEISYSFTDNFSFPDKSRPFGDLDTNGDGDRDERINATSEEFSGLLDGEQYQVRARNSPTQPRRGELSNYWDVTTSWQVATTILPAPTSLTASTSDFSKIDLSWQDNANNETQYDVLFREVGDTSWTVNTLSTDTTATTLSSLNSDTEYEMAVRVVTDHTSTQSGTASATTYLNTSRSTSSHSGKVTSATIREFALDRPVASHTIPINSSSQRVVNLGRNTSTFSGPTSSSTIRVVDLGRPTESYADKMTSFTYTDRTSLEMVDYQIDWDDEKAVWYTNWFQETRITGDEDNLALRAKVVEGSKEPAAKVQVQYDKNGDGIPDEETRIIDIGKAEDLHQIDDIPISESGQYRLKIMDYSGFNSLISIDFGIVH